jgi:uncharacterized repeat protein (TIGR02543 family)
MNKVVLNLLVIAAIAVSAAFVASCDSKDDDVKSFTVEFESNGGGTVASQTVKDGDLITEPKDPEREGYTFDGWYSDNDTFDKAWDFANGKVTEDVKLYAKWIENGLTKLEISVVNGSSHSSEIDNVKLTFGNINPIVLTSAVAYGNGTFTVELPETVDAAYFTAVDEYYGSTVTISNKNAKIAFFARVWL